jgi:uncharacterized delta-60 repeat protein
MSQRHAFSKLFSLLSACGVFLTATALALPTITQQPTNVTVNYGTAASFSVSATGTSALRFQWCRDGVAVTNATNAILSFASARTSDQGVYGVVVTDSASVTSASASLLVITNPPYFTLQPSNTTVRWGGSANFTANVSGIPAPSLQWERNGTNIPYYATYDTLYVGATDETAGVYRLRASNVAGVVYSDPAVLTLDPSPAIDSEPVELVVREGRNVQFWNRVYGKPPLWIRWFRDGLPLSVETNSILNLNNVRPTNSGMYYLVVTNSFGAVTSSIFGLTVNAAPTNAGALDINFELTSAGAVSAIAVRGDGRMLMAGSFYTSNFLASGLRQFLPDGSWDQSFTPATFDGPVKSITLGADGSAYIGGGFTTVSDTPRQWLAKLDTMGTLIPSFNSRNSFSSYAGNLHLPSIQSIGLRDDGKLIVLGTEGISARMNPDGSIEKYNVIPLPSEAGGSTPPPPSTYRGLQQMHDGSFLLCEIYGSGGVPWRVFPNGAVSVFRTANYSNGFEGTRCVIELPGGNALVGGGFYLNSLAPGFVRRALSDGSQDFSFAAAPISGGIVKCIAIQSDGKIFIGGDFDKVGGIDRRGIARLNADGTLDVAFDPGLGVAQNYWNPTSVGSVEQIKLLSNNRVLLAGAFGAIDGVERANVAVLYNDTVSNVEIVSQPTNQTVTAGQEAYFHADLSRPAAIQWKREGNNVTGATNATLYVSSAKTSDAGHFRLIASNAFGVVTSAVATLIVLPAPSYEGAPDVTFDSSLGADDRIRAMVRLADGRILIGGYFSAINGVPRHGVARLLADGSVDPTFDPGAGIGSSPSAHVQAIAIVPDGKIMVGGFFTNFNGVARRSVIRLNGDGSLDSTFNAGTGAEWRSAAVKALAIQSDGRILVGGDFSSFQGGSGALVRLQTNGALDSFLANIYDSVYAIAIQRNGRVLIGGDKGVARFYADGAKDNSFSTYSSVDWTVRALLIDSDESILVGTINSFSPVSRLKTNGALLASYSPPYDFAHSHAYALSRDECGSIYAGGSMAIASGFYGRVVRLSPTLSPAFVVGNNSIDGYVYALAPAPETGGVLIAGDFANVGGVAARGIARLHSGAGAPVITSISTNRTAAPGSPVSLSISISNCAQPAIQWWLNGQPVERGSNSTLSFIARPTRGGDYFAVVSNFAGVVTSTVVNLTVLRAAILPGSRDMDFIAPDWIFERVLTIAEQTDGKIVLGGFGEQVFDPVFLPLEFPVMRLELDGSIDANFQVPRVTSGWGFASNLVLQADQRLLVGGVFYFYGALEKGFIRLNTNGALDLFFKPNPSYAHSINVHPDGRIAYSSSWYGMFRVMEAGDFDVTFTNSSSYVTHMLLLPEGKYLAAVSGLSDEYGNLQSVLKRFNSDGALDPGFISPRVTGTFLSCALQPDGHIVVAGNFTNIGAQAYGRVARFQADGSLDSEFAIGLGANAEVRSIAVQPDGKIVLGGSFTQVDGVARYGVARLLASGAVDLGFAPTIAPAFRVLTVFVGDLGRIYAGGAVPRGNGYYKGQVIRLHGDIFGTHPAITNDSFSMQTMTADGWNYHLERTSSSQPFVWTNVVSILGTGTPQTLVDPAPVSGSFYRIRVD